MNISELLAEVYYQNEDTREGWCTPTRSGLLARTIYNNKLTNCLVIGVFAGKSTFAVATALKAIGRGNVDACDAWLPSASAVGQEGKDAEWWKTLDHEAIYNIFMEKRTKYGLEQFITVHRMTNRELYPLVKNKVYDYAEIDGNHGEEDCTFDVEHFVPLLRVGGILWADDLNWSGADKAYARLPALGMKKIGELDTGALFIKEKS